MQQLTCITPTLCRLIGIELPEISTKEVIADLIEESLKLLNGRKIDKCLVYAPDAIGEALFQDYSDDFGGVAEIAPFQVVLRSVFPSVTPVVFGSMFTGALPEAHGITQYEKPVLKCDTTLDALLRSMKKVAIVAVEGSSARARRDLMCPRSKYWWITGSNPRFVPKSCDKKRIKPFAQVVCDGEQQEA